MSPRTFTGVLAVFCTSTLLGCANTTTPILDSRFGDAVVQARLLQTLNPDASNNNDPVAGLDGEAARHAMERYQESFKVPPATFNVINIGGQ